VAGNLSIKKKLHDSIGYLVLPGNGGAPVTGIDVSGQFRPEELDAVSMARNLNAAFLTVLCGPAAPGYDTALRGLAGADTPASRFLSVGIDLITSEVGERYDADPGFRRDLDALQDHINAAVPGTAAADAIRRVWQLFFPEGESVEDIPARVAALRKKRSVRITGLNERPVRAPEKEVLFTANALLTVPASTPGGTGLDPLVRAAVEGASAEEQLYWYDHPIPVAAGGDNELIHGLRGLSEAVLFEERAGGKDAGINIDCVLSVSVTHARLRGASRPWIESMLSRAGAVRGINLYVFTEEDTTRLLEEVLLPAARHYFDGRDTGPLREVYGVDGEYGRHYSFLKAIATFWRVFVAPDIRATFKFDLDQVFPQEELVRATGASAFGHLRTPLWGARGIDSGGESVYLGMLAGALVNRKDIGVSLFTPDVPFPGRDPAGDEAVFWSAVPQAVSTAAEMAGGPVRPVVDAAIQRVHVTGGTTGILTEALERYRPFTPSCIGRAEDQAYLLSVLFRPDERGYLRYAHEPGLIMRHDADLYALPAGASRTGKIHGDYVRTILFTDYARGLPWPEERIKNELAPFTGSFISRIPITIAYLRFALRAALLFASDRPEEGLDFFNGGVKRLSGMMESRRSGDNFFNELYEREKRGWDLYYDVLEIIEKRLSGGEPFARELAERAAAAVAAVKINCG
jgi:hypothetical protein